MKLDWLDAAAESLADSGFYCGHGVLDLKLLHRWCQFVSEEDQRGAFLPANIGRGQRLQRETSVRGDRIRWVDSNQDQSHCQELFDFLDHLKNHLNRLLFAGIANFEGHFAIYPPGALYQRHVDVFRDDDSRLLTLIVYLNEGWEPSHGGLLRVFQGKTLFKEISPMLGTVVLFKSREFPHEVTESLRERRSFTGWFCVRGRQK